jgi:hypothetical protein
MTGGGFSHGRRRALATLAAFAGTMLERATAEPSLSRARPRASGVSGSRKITHLIGANGLPSSDSDVAMWHDMGIEWGRDSVGPGQVHSADDPMIIDRTGPTFAGNLPSALLRNRPNGIKSLLLLGYTPKWNASVPNDGRSAPKVVTAWERYVEAVVRKYAARPYNVTHFQIWNEAAGALSGGSPQATFWHGQSRATAAVQMLSMPYDRAMQDYVERIHIPAARIVRHFGARVVYGGWPDQGGVDTFMKWLEYRSPRFNARMLDWVDYLDTHYLGVDALTPLYDRYVANGAVRGIWQTEIGDRYMIDPHYLPMYFFKFAVWALERNWDDPDKYVSMIYHWDGVESYRLTRRGNPRTYTVSGRSLVVLRTTVPGALRRFSGSLACGPDASASALYSDADIVVQVQAQAGWRTVALEGLSAPSASNYGVRMVDALTGAAQPADAVSAEWQDGTLRMRFKVPDEVNGAGRTPPSHLAYLIVGTRL